MGSIQSSYADNRSYGFQSLSGPWSSQADVAPQAVRTYFSQNAYDLPLGSNAIYMGDRWRPDLLGSSRYVWYPLDFSSGSPTLVHADVWSVNLQSGRGFVKSRSPLCFRWRVDRLGLIHSLILAGTYTVASGTSYEAESGTLGGSSTLLSDSSFSGGRAVGYLGMCTNVLRRHSLINPRTPGHGGTVTLQNVQGDGREHWVALYYANGDSTWRNVTVRSAGNPFLPIGTSC